MTREADHAKHTIGRFPGRARRVSIPLPSDEQLAIAVTEHFLRTRMSPATKASQTQFPHSPLLNGFNWRTVNTRFAQERGQLFSAFCNAVIAKCPKAVPDAEIPSVEVL